jgi:hypothetical protein
MVKGEQLEKNGKKDGLKVESCMADRPTLYHRGELASWED